MCESFLEKSRHNDHDQNNIELGPSSSFQLDFDTQIDELLESMPIRADSKNLDNKSNNSKQKCLVNLLKALESKERAAELMLEEASVEAKRKLSLISQITNSFVVQKDSLVIEQFLPRMVEFYKTQQINSTSRNEKSNVNFEPNLSSLKIKSQWTCFLSDSFSFNFVFRNESW